MRILIVEDEALIAQRVERLTRNILGNSLQRLTLKPTFEAARSYLKEYPLDLMILDLNLNGKDGFGLLEESVAGAFQTIILSAYIDKAIQAYEYGVLDFIPKPFNQDRLAKAFDRYQNLTERAAFPTKFLAIRKRQQLTLVEVADIAYLKGSGNHAQLVLNSGQTYLHDKSLQQLSKLLPTHFERIHKSYIVNLKMIKSISRQYEVQLINGELLPISRTKFKALKATIG